MGLNRGMLRLAGAMIPRTQPRVADQRCEPRHEDLTDRAILSFRGQDHLVPVLNISQSGVMIEIGLSPNIGESVTVQLEHGIRVPAFVRWVREGRIGLNFRQPIPLG
jgi:hypothetical protein